MPLDPNLRILLVEDAAVMRKMEIKTLNSLGLTNIIQAENGNDAIEKLQHDKNIQLIISDWNMPEKDGFELLVWVREHKDLKDIPFLMATGRGEKKEVAKASEAGANSFISKPFNAEELRVKIEEAIGEKPAEEKVAERRKPVITDAGKVVIKMAHIQITDHLVLGVLKHMINSGKFVPKHFELETECMSSWNPVAKALEDGTVDGACVLAPIAMDLFNDGTPIKLVLFAHKNGSILIRNKKGGNFYSEKEGFFKNKAFYIPHTLSIHNMLAHMFFSNLGLKPGVTGKEEVDISFEVAPPVKMPEFLSVNENSAGYLVAEPLGTKAIATGIGELQFLSAELWENHPCCVVTLQQDFIENHTEAVFELTDLMVKAGKFIEQQPGAAAQIAVDFLDPDKSLGLKVPLLKNVLTEPMGIKTGDLYPVTEDLEKIQRYMHDKMGVGNIIDIDSFVDLRFAKSACKDVNKKLRVSKLNNSLDAAQELLFRKDVSAEDLAAKALLNLEGKYLMFELNNRSFGIDILKIREIIRMVTIRTIPESPSYVLGVIDLRGNIVPVIDPKHIFNIIRQTTSKKQVIIVLETETENGVFQLGIVVDSVSQVTNITASEIEDTPSFVKSNKTSYFLAIAKIEGQLSILVDISKLLDQQKMKTLRHVA